MEINIYIFDSDNKYVEQKKADVPKFFHIGSRLFKVNTDGSHFSHYRTEDYFSKDLQYSPFLSLEEYVTAVINGEYTEATKKEWLDTAKRICKLITE